LIAATIAQLHGTESGINEENAVTERLDPVNGVGDTPNARYAHRLAAGWHGVNGNDDLTCGNWTSSSQGCAQVGHHDRMGQEGALEFRRMSRADAVRTRKARAAPDRFIFAVD
jgi:hypothetical protein